MAPLLIFSSNSVTITNKLCNDCLLNCEVKGYDWKPANVLSPNLSSFVIMSGRE